MKSLFQTRPFPPQQRSRATTFGLASSWRREGRVIWLIVFEFEVKWPAKATVKIREFHQQRNLARKARSETVAA